MSKEADLIAATTSPVTTATLRADLAALGVGDGDVVAVHSSMSKLGWVAGGAQSVVEALLAVVGDSGTLVMPTHSGQLTDPAGWENPPVPAAWVDTIRDDLPAFDPHTTTTRQMGAIVDCFRSYQATQRSSHPHVSFAANGPRASEIVGAHPLAPATGETSPLGRLYELDARVLLLGVGHGNNTSMHLAEERANWPGKSTATFGAPVKVDGQRQWVTWDDLDVDEGDFEVIGDAFATAGHESTGPVGMGIGRLMSQPRVVDFAVEWMNEHRPGSLG